MQNIIEGQADLLKKSDFKISLKNLGLSRLVYLIFGYDTNQSRHKQTWLYPDPDETEPKNYSG